MTKLPKTIEYSMQPYTHGAILGDLSYGDFNGHPTLTGTVIEGTETSRLFTASSTKGIVGRRITVYGIKDYEIERGEIIRVAM